MLRDRILAGIRNRPLSEKLQLQDNLTLERATQMVRQAEQVKKQTPQLLGTTPQTPGTAPETAGNFVNRIGPNRRGRFPQGKSDDHKGEGGFKNQAPRPKTYRNPQASTGCRRCGRGPHDQRDCPAFNSVCNRCKIQGHYAQFCRTKSAVGAVQEEEEDLFIGSVIGSIAAKKSWDRTVDILGQQVSLRADTGADYTCISEETYHQHFKSHKLTPSKKCLKGADQHTLDVMGSLHAPVSYQGRTTEVEIYVIRNLGKSLLDGESCEALNIVQRINAVDEPKMSFDPLQNCSQVSWAK